MRQKYLNNVQRSRFLKVKNELLKLENDFIELKDLKDKDIKIKRKIENLFFQPIIVSVNDMDKFEQNKMKKEIPKNTLYLKT